MNFFDRQEHARKQTRRLIFLFGLAVLAVIGLTYFILANLILSAIKPTPGFGRTILPYFTTVLEVFAEAVMHPRDYLHWLWDGWLACWITLGCLVSIAGGCLYKLRQLSTGGAAVAELLGGRPVALKPESPEEQQLRHVVEEMAIAATLPAPEIYVLDNERGINAFAAGHTRDDTAITITRGALKLLSRDELQGVVAHEFSHILNGDTRLNMKLIALAHGLFWPTILGRVLIYGDTEPLAADEFIVVASERRKMLPTALPGFFLVVIGSLGLPFVRLLKKPFAGSANGWRTRQPCSSPAIPPASAAVSKKSAACSNRADSIPPTRRSPAISISPTRILIPGCRGWPPIPRWNRASWPLTRRLTAIFPR